MAGDTVETFDPVGSVSEVLETSCVTGTTHLIRIFSAELHFVHLVTVETTNILLPVGTDPPFTVCNTVAVLAGFSSHGENHLSFIRVVFVENPMTGFAGDSFFGVFFCLPVILANVTNKTFPFPPLPLPIR
jgi:hypothetical protein